MNPISRDDESKSSTIDVEAKNKVLAQISSMREQIIELLQGQVRIRSVNPSYPNVVYADELGGETRVNELMKPVMESFGVQTEWVTVEPGRSNLVGVLKGSGNGRSLIFNGHVDVVPPGPENLWTEAGPWSGDIKNGRLYGRGATDMKAGNVAAVKALEAVTRAGYRPKGDVIIEHVVGEEMMETAAGTGAVIEAGYRADAAIVVEPSGPPYSLGIVPASPSTSHLRITIPGKATHSSMRDELVRAGGLGPAAGVHAVDKAMIIYNALNLLEQEWGQTKSHPAFTRPGHFTIHPGSIAGGEKGPYVVSEKCTLDYAIWAAPQDSEESIRSEIEAQIKRFADTDPWLREHPPLMEWLLFWPGYDVPVDGPISQTLATAYRTALDKEPRISGFAAVHDGSFLNRAGIPTISLGPGSITVAHAANEYVEIDELIDATKIYAMAILEWCGYQ